MSDKQITFSEKLEILKEIYQKIKTFESNDLDTVIALYQEGILLSKEIQKDLSQYEQKIIAIESESNVDANVDTAPSSRKSDDSLSSIDNPASINPDIAIASQDYDSSFEDVLANEDAVSPQKKPRKSVHTLPKDDAEDITANASNSNTQVSKTSPKSSNTRKTHPKNLSDIVDLFSDTE